MSKKGYFFQMSRFLSEYFLFVLCVFALFNSGHTVITVIVYLATLSLVRLICGASGTTLMTCQTNTDGADRQAKDESMPFEFQCGRQCWCKHWKSVSSPVQQPIEWRLADHALCGLRFPRLCEYKTLQLAPVWIQFTLRLANNDGGQ